MEETNEKPPKMIKDQVLNVTATAKRFNRRKKENVEEQAP